MATILDRIIRHSRSSIDCWQSDQGDDWFTVDLPKYEKFENVRIDIRGGKNNAVAKIEAQPNAGEVGQGKRIKVHWSYTATSNPGDPPFIEYRLRAFTAPAPTRSRKRAILVAIENTGALPFDLGLSEDLKTTVERFVDRVAEFGEEANCRNLFNNYYQKAVILCDENCTKENIRDQIITLAKEYILDMTILGHGSVFNGEGVLILHGGMDHWETNPANLRESDVLSWKRLLDNQGIRLGLMYMMNCQGSKFSDTWLKVGFKTSVGAKGNNWMPEPMFTYFWTRYRNGEAADYAAAKSWEDSKNLWQMIYVPDLRLEKIETPPFLSLTYTENTKITDSIPVVTGNPGFCITNS